MNENEYPELLRFVRAELERIGRPDLDQFAFASVERAERPSDAFFGYSVALLQQLHLESQEGVASATGHLNRALESSDAGFVDDILLVPTDQEQLTINRDVVSLREILPERASFLQELGQLVRELQEERDRSR
jgi:hypothetical protein